MSQVLLCFVDNKQARCFGGAVRFCSCNNEFLVTVQERCTA